MRYLRKIAKHHTIEEFMAPVGVIPRETFVIEVKVGGGVSETLLLLGRIPDFTNSPCPSHPRRSFEFQRYE